MINTFINLLVTLILLGRLLSTYSLCFLSIHSTVWTSSLLANFDRALTMLLYFHMVAMIIDDTSMTTSCNSLSFLTFHLYTKMECCLFCSFWLFCQNILATHNWWKSCPWLDLNLTVNQTDNQNNQNRCAKRANIDAAKHKPIYLNCCNIESLPT